MKKYTLTVLDTSGTQDYIFSTNRLQEIIGASQLVYEATRDWPDILLQEMFPGGAVTISTRQSGDIRRIENDSSVQAEVVYSGGGNIVILFRSHEDGAVNFARKITRKVLEDAPGLQVLLAHEAMDFDHDSLSKTVSHVIDTKLAVKKQNRKPVMPLLGLGVSLACTSTGLPASDLDKGHRAGDEQDDYRPISSQVIQKLDARDRGNQRLETLFKEELGDWYKFPHDIDKLGRISGEESYVAVVHADGNNMGKRVADISSRFSHPEQNRDYIAAMRQFSDSIEAASIAALRRVVSALTRMPPDQLATEDNFLPLRPLVFGGDDVTFACRGRFGLPLAALYLKTFEEQKLEGVPADSALMHACAGISIVKMHYPFSRAYDLSEKLAKSAKEYARESQDDISCLDWHISTSGLGGNLKTIREREYQIELNEGKHVPEHNQLNIRPLRLTPAAYDTDGRAWFGRIERVVRELQTGDDWKDRRNKVKALREALRQGRPAVIEFRHNYSLPALPQIIPDSNLYTNDGWGGNKCGYFDAIELIDHYQPVE